MLDQQRSGHRRGGTHRRTLEQRPSGVFLVPGLQLAFQKPADVGGADLADEIIDRAHRDTGGKPVAVPQQPRRHEAAVRSAGQTDPRGVEVSQRQRTVEDAQDVAGIEGTPIAERGVRVRVAVGL